MFYALKLVFVSECDKGYFTQENGTDKKDTLSKTSREQDPVSNNKKKLVHFLRSDQNEK